MHININMQISDIDNLFELSDLQPEEYRLLKEKYLAKGQSNNLQKHVIGRLTIPRLRNTVRPPGENYAPICYNKDYMIKNLTQLLAMYGDSKISYPAFRAFSTVLNKFHYIESAIFRQCKRKGRKISRSEFANGKRRNVLSVC